MQDFQTPGATLFVPVHKLSVKRGFGYYFYELYLCFSSFLCTADREEVRKQLITVESKLWANSTQGRLV